jgi:hypothetical protein
LASRREIALLALLAATAILGRPGLAQADGDPASDVLLTQHVFFPIDAQTSTAAQKTLITAVSEANNAGYPIRVAVIEKPTDLGLVTSLWAKPKQYSRFLGVELGYVFRGPLLVVMPAGLGFAHYKKSTQRESRDVASIAVEGGSDGPALTAVRAVERLSALSGHPIAAPPPPKAGSMTSWPEIGGAVLIVMAAAGAAVMFALIRSRRGRRSTS